MSHHYWFLIPGCPVSGRTQRSRPGPAARPRRAAADRAWLKDLLAQGPSRLLYVGHATAADGDVGHADRAALHLADDRPLTASDLMSLRLPLPPRVGLLACA